MSVTRYMCAAANECSEDDDDDVKLHKKKTFPKLCPQSFVLDPKYGVCVFISNFYNVVHRSELHHHRSASETEERESGRSCRCACW